VLLACFVLCASALGVLLWAEATERQRVKVVAKPMASTAFVGVALVHLSGAASLTPYATWIIIGLVFGGLGDACLMLPGKKWFLAGMAAFSVGHGAYVVAFDRLVAWTDWWSPASAAPLVAGAAAYAWLHPHLGRMRWPVVGYIVVIVSMAVGAVAASATSPVGQIAGLGAGAFFISDLTVARDRFVQRSFANRMVGLPLYYGGQLLIASSLGAGPLGPG